MHQTCTSPILSSTVCQSKQDFFIICILIFILGINFFEFCKILSFEFWIWWWQVSQCSSMSCFLFRLRIRLKWKSWTVGACPTKSYLFSEQNKKTSGVEPLKNSMRAKILLDYLVISENVFWMTSNFSLGLKAVLKKKNTEIE